MMMKSTTEIDATLRLYLVAVSESKTFGFTRRHAGLCGTFENSERGMAEIDAVLSEIHDETCRYHRVLATSAKEACKIAKRS